MTSLKYQSNTYQMLQLWRAVTTLNIHFERKLIFESRTAPKLQDCKSGQSAI